MKRAACILLGAALTVAGADKKPGPASTGNDDIEITAVALLEPEEIRNALGAELGPGFVVLKVKVTPKAESPIRIGPDDFQLLSHKDGQRCGAMAPTQIAGSSTLVVSTNTRGGAGIGSQGNGPVWGGLGGDRPRRMGGDGGAIGSTGAETSADARIQSKDKPKANPLLDALSAKVLADKESKEPVEGLLYFLIEGKVKVKELSLIYKGPAGRLVASFK